MAGTADDIARLLRKICPGDCSTCPRDVRDLCDTEQEMRLNAAERERRKDEDVQR